MIQEDVLLLNPVWFVPIAGWRSFPNEFTENNHREVMERSQYFVESENLAESTKNIL